MRTLRQELIDKGLANQKKHQEIPPPRKSKPRFYSDSEILKEKRKREIEELMGMNRPKYYRSKGSYRSR